MPKKKLESAESLEAHPVHSAASEKRDGALEQQQLQGGGPIAHRDACHRLVAQHASNYRLGDYGDLGHTHHAPAAKGHR